MSIASRQPSEIEPRTNGAACDAAFVSRSQRKRAIEKLFLHDHFDGQGMIGTTLIAFSGDPFTILELTAR
jgi:hypothetical protein